MLDRGARMRDFRRRVRFRLRLTRRMWRVTAWLVAPMICSWRDFIRPASACDAELSGRWNRRIAAGKGFAFGNDNVARKTSGAACYGGAEGISGERQFALALSLARMLSATRAQLAIALRDLSLARLGRERPDALFSHMVERNVDDAIYAIGRDGPAMIDETVRRAVDDIVREAALGTGAPYFAD